MRRNKGYLVIGEQGRWRHASDQWSNGVASHSQHGTVAPCVVTRVVSSTEVQRQQVSRQGGRGLRHIYVMASLGILP